MMAYFSNGTEGLAYQEHYCFTCEHRPEDDDDGDCPIWSAHFFWNGEYHKTPAVKSILDALIPMVDRTFRDGITVPVAGECRFYQRRQESLPFGD